MKLRTLKNLILEYISYSLKLEKALNKPVIQLLETTNACMMQCIMCARSSMSRKIKHMEMDLFKKIIDQAEWNNEIWLHFLGDPLLHPEIDGMINYTSRKGIKTRISTNPKLLSEEVCERLLASSLGTIQISLDAIDDRTYKYFRGGNADYNEAVTNIHRLVNLKNERKSKLEIIEAMTYMKKNKKDAKAFKRIWAIEGIDEVFLNPLLVKNVSIGRIAEQGDEDTYSKAFKQRPAPRCITPWTSVQVTAAGKVVPCCFDYDETYVLGDLKEDSLQKIWNNSRSRLLRRQVKHKALHQNPLCRTCRERKGSLKEHYLRCFFYPLRTKSPALAPIKPPDK